jgi:hypothetical protein
MIVRIWHGWTSGDNADAYQQLLDTTIVPTIIARESPAYAAWTSCVATTITTPRSSSSPS